MKREILRALAIIAAAGMFATGCAHRTVVHESVVTTAPAGEVVVSTEPPPLRHEVIGVAPSPRHVWVNGYWVRTNNRWAWVAGHYEERPREGVVWVKGHWDHTDRGWVWTPGHWA